ncbi:hypothetical protein [Zavarzinella formosa]|uniref:hypothetical protein n=1 Tax=Zavarzinella formosa TaxID=360055 RepID=UPI0002FD6DB6|nr:hypothetical protein [Zavarzinella formosa]
MPDCSAVESVLVSVVTRIVYPNGTGAASATGDKCKVFRGWPVPSGLDADLKAGFVNISVFPLDPEQNLTRYSTEWRELPVPNITLAMTVAGKTVTVGGSASCPLNAAVIVNNQGFVHPLQATDTPTSVATALAAMISSLTAATSVGPVITIPGATSLAARVGAVGRLVREIKRQKKSFVITVWCGSPRVRDAFGRILDAGLSDVTFLSLCDGTDGRLRYERTHVDDASQKSGLYRRDFFYSVEYGTTVAQNAAEAVVETINIAGGLDPDAPTLKSISF